MYRRIFKYQRAYFYPRSLNAIIINKVLEYIFKTINDLISYKRILDKLPKIGIRIIANTVKNH